MAAPLSRRSFLTRSALVGCSLAASPAITPVTFAAAPGENRLVVILLRGGMDGLDAVRPLGDPDFAALRGGTERRETSAPIDLDGFFAAHPALAPLAPLWRAGEAGFVHAVSTPYRDKRSHFDGQDLLEAGTAGPGGDTRDGWLNRLLRDMPGARAETAYAVGSDALTILSGDAPAARWTPEVDLTMSPQAIALAELVMGDDPAFAGALRQALANADADGDGVAFSGGPDDMMAQMVADMRATRRDSAEVHLARFAAGRLREETRIAAFSLNGWDTHRAQWRNLPPALDRLSNAILTLRAELHGPVWQRTAIVGLTEFGRTARMNGSLGTDHGTGGLMVLAGGAIRGGRVVTDWPGLSEADLYDRRDLMPTRDLRAHLGWLVRGLFGTSRGTLERAVFPGLDLGDDPALLL